jgi:hypothetical protein
VEEQPSCFCYSLLAAASAEPYDRRALNGVVKIVRQILVQTRDAPFSYAPVKINGEPVYLKWRKHKSGAG